MTPPRFCESCGRRASDDARFCGGCGRPIAGATAVPQAPGAGAAARSEPAPGGPEETVLEVRPVAVRTFWEFLFSVLTVGLVWIWLRICRRTVRYRITTQRIEVVSGLFTVTRRTTDLFRVQDLEIVEPFFLRIRGAGNLVVRAQDAGEPELVLTAIPDVRRTHEMLRSLVQTERRSAHVRVVEDGR